MVLPGMETQQLKFYIDWLLRCLCCHLSLSWWCFVDFKSPLVKCL